MKIHRRIASISATALKRFIGVMLMVLGMWAAVPGHAEVTFRDSASASVSNGTVVPPWSITYIGSGNVASSGSSGSLTPSLPAHIAGDLLICLVESRSNGAHGLPNNWTLRYEHSQGSDHRASLFYRFATAANHPSPTFSHSGAAVARCAGYRGVDPSAPIQFSGQNLNNDNDVDTGSLSGVSGTMLLFAAHYSDGQTRTLTYPNQWDIAFASNTNRVGIGLAHRTWFSPGTAGGFNADLSGTADRTYGALIALRPLGYASPPSPGALVINKPAGSTEDDVMIASIAVARGSGNSPLTITPPDGWTLLNQENQSSGNRSQLATYWRVAGANEPASYAWSFSGNHVGAVGTISTYAGVDPVTPIDVSAGQTTGSGHEHTAPSVTPTVAGGMLVTAHAYATSRQWNPIGNGMTEAGNIASETPNNTAGVSMQINYQQLSSIAPTGARTADAGESCVTWLIICWAWDHDPGAAQSIVLRPASTVVPACFDDPFNDEGTPGPNWAVSNSHGSGSTFGNPVVVGGRLRLTNDSGNNATRATIQRLFPGAGNRIQIEFDHYAYGGSGADGIAVVLSDSAVTPSPGGYGGSLGYAQNTSASPSKPGFAGGWLGVGIDEFGNFSNPTEGREQGPGVRVDSVAIRGSGSGTTGYRYHTGTAANLSPEVDGNGAANPPHRYRIIVDHSDGVKANVSVLRNTGGGFIPLVTTYDAKQQLNQADVPLNWILSFTGSTGGSTNIHEIDNLSVCATSLLPASAIHHFVIAVNQSASTCFPHSVTITAKDADGNTLTNYTGTIHITTSSGHGTWSKGAGANGTLTEIAPDDGVASYNFSASDNGSATLLLSNTHADDLTISVTDIAVATSLTTTPTVAFRDSAFVITPDPIQIAGRPQSMSARLYTRVGSSCPVDGNYSGAKTLDAWLTRDAIDPGGAAPTIASLTLPSAAPPVNAGSNNLTLNFTAGVTNFTMNTTDVGKYSLNLRDDTRGYANAIELIGVSESITTRPWLHLAVPRNPGGTSPTAALFGTEGTPPNNTIIPAGADFQPTVRGVLWQAADDADNNGVADPDANLSNNTAAPSFRWDTELSAMAPFTPASGVLGTLNGGDVPQSAYTGGVATPTVQYTEVGSFTMRGSVENYLDTPSADLVAVAGPIGRFRPHDFGVATNEPKFTSFCGAGTSGFTYIGQSFSYETQPVLTVTARNALGSTTQNYTQSGGWFKLTNGSLSGKAYSANNGTLDLGLIPSVDPEIEIAAPGVATLTFSDGGGISFVRADPVAPFDAEISLAINVQDSEGVSFDSNPARFGATTAGNGIAFANGKQMRFGRLRLLNSLGALHFPTPLRMQVEYWNGSAFLANTADSCTTLHRSDFAVGNYQLYAPPESCPTALTTDPITFTSGAAIAQLASPTGGAQGSIELRANLGAASGQYCASAGGAQEEATSAVSSYLKGRWNDNSDGDGDGVNTGYDDDPVAKIRFGVYGPQAPKRFIYSRENY